MAKTDEKFLEDRLGMTETDGWLDLIQDLQNLEENIGNLNNINSEQDLPCFGGPIFCVFVASVSWKTFAFVLCIFRPVKAQQKLRSMV